MNRRTIAFVVLCAVAATASITYVVHAAERDAEVTRAAGPARPAASRAEIATRPHLVFRATDPGRAYGQVALVALSAPERAQATTALSCERVDFAGGRGLCLQADRGVITSYRAVVFDERFRELRSFRLAGAPSRTRVSPDGRRAAYTVFVSGHSYAAANFSTRTAIVDTSTGKELAELEKFTTMRNGRVFRRVDFNFWGVTFSRDPNRFYATLGTGGKTYLVEGDLAARVVRVVHDDVECPALSPDEQRIAFKHRSGGRFGPVKWRVSVLDLASGRVTPLTELRTVDDQVEWLDGGHVLYGLPRKGTAFTDVWSVRADGTGRPVRLLSGAWSPSVVRAAA